MQDFITFLWLHPLLISSILVVAFLLFIIEMWRLQKNLGGLSPQAAVQLINHEHAAILDVRDDIKFKEGHIVHAQHFPQNDVLTTKKLDKLKQKPLLIVCQIGTNAHKIAHELNKKGFKAHALQGGMKAWYDANLPTVKEAHHHG